jgi:phage replication-related protein YjqB (UPF0714/DUF867 family)
VLDQLLAQPGVVERVELRGRLGFMAFHGGSLERMTDVIATEAADRAGASLYVVAQPEELRWHVPSRLFDPTHSERLAAFLDHVDDVVAVHGYGRATMFTTLLLGGGDRDLAAALAEPLADALPDYEVVHDLDQVPVDLRGQHPDNPVNRVRGGGVQLELPPRVRGLGPYWEGRPDRAAHRRALVDGLARFAAGHPRLP